MWAVWLRLRARNKRRSGTSLDLYQIARNGAFDVFFRKRRIFALRIHIAFLPAQAEAKFREAIIGHAEVRQTYKVSAIGTIAGCYVKDGKITRDASVRVLRDNIVIHEGKLGSLQRFKDSVKEVAAGYECGMSIEKYNDIKEGDIFECFVMEQIKE